ncbi:MAG: glycine--tRNA ligase [Euryarchaeota archaeon]|nr:glycine--tRNA ligase [Euryarchaeota archaeon]
MPEPPDTLSKVLALAKRRGFFWPSCEIYGGVAGFYDYGPLGAQLKASVEGLWRSYYVAGEGFAELSAPAISPEAVFRASGHLEKFSDLMAECGKCGEAFRADHLLRELAPGEEPPASVETMAAALRRAGARCPKCGGDLSEPFAFNLMFRTNIGPGTRRPGYLRPETAQAMFLDFGLLYRHFREKLPFGAVQIGRGFRNEIAPRQGIIRLREFNMAEAEVFVDPERKARHPRFSEVAGMRLRLVPGEGPEGDLSLGEAVSRGTMAHESIAYFVGLTARFLVEAGVDPARLRFRQHAQDEMAHYAADCWDAETLLSFGWTEVVGVADRTCYDLEAHMRASGQDLRAFARYETPVTVERTVVAPVHAVLGPRFKKDARAVARALEALEAGAVEGRDSVEVEADGRKLKVEKDCFTVKKTTETSSGRWFTPHVIEPSYGIDRIIYSVLEHAYSETKKEGEDYFVLRLRPMMAPIQVAVFPLLNKDELVAVADDINRRLGEAGFRTHSEAADSIGRRYARMDEVGAPFCVTVDFDTLKDGTVTVRDRDTTRQVRLALAEVAGAVGELIEGTRRID